MTKSRKPVESVSSRYTPIPHAVLDSEALRRASHTARSLLLDIVRQHNGSNNGRLQVTYSWLQKRGWKSAGTIQKARNELIKRGLIVHTRQGGLNAGPNWYAVTWLPISNFVGLDIQPKDYHTGAWSLLDEMPPVKFRKHHSEIWSSAAPAIGTGDALAALPIGAKTALSGAIAVPKSGNNECLPLPTRKTPVPVIGKKGRSGISNQQVMEVTE